MLNLKLTCLLPSQTPWTKVNVRIQFMAKVRQLGTTHADAFKCVPKSPPPALTREVIEKIERELNLL